VDPAFALFAPILDIVRRLGRNGDRVARGINGFLMAHEDRLVPDEARILKCQDALRDPDTSSVANLGNGSAWSLARSKGFADGISDFLPSCSCAVSASCGARFMEFPQRRWSKALMAILRPGAVRS
jgi:hypothetical protein